MVGTTRSSGPRAVVLSALSFALFAGCSQATSSTADRPAVDATEVNLGYTSEGSSTSTASVTSVSGDEIRRSSTGHIVDLLRRAPGVVVSQGPDGRPALRVRGARSLMGTNEPLVVIYGRPIRASSFMSAVEGIDARDIERIDVLRDPGSLAMYGSRGSNGVIVITMKTAR